MAETQSVRHTGTRPRSAIVYVVEADPGVRHSLRTLLETLGVVIRDFDSAESLLADPSFIDDAPACVVADACLPEMSGLDLIRFLQRRDTGVPTILLSREGDVATAVEAMREGALDVIERPDFGGHILRRVRSILQQRRSQL